MLHVVNGQVETMTSAQESAFLAQQSLSDIPQEVSMRQARLALFNAGLLSQVDAAIAAMSEPDKTIADIQWNHASSVVRANSLVTSLGGALGLSGAQLDQLFVTAWGL
jgi:hypothetical protein